ncbi:hypothetical protein [Mesorhizobium sp. CA5]|uniref:hypothetical protein n=1 Tax=Mesorhizobium sp. CA5 TaxID=2876638 RepID=UPI001CD0B741|nr:hypothetical protein [Mesorhizobium sp. CA5]
MRLFSLFPANRPWSIGKLAKKPRGMMSAGTTAQPRGRLSAALSFHDNLSDGRLRPAAIDVCGHKAA